MKTKLKNIIEIKTGYFAKPEKNGDYYYIHTKYFNEYGFFNKDELQKEIKDNQNVKKYLLDKNDILFSSKGRFFSYLFNEQEKKYIASSSFFIIKIINNKRVIPEFINWYLNLDVMNKLYNKLKRGTSITSITKKNLMDIDIIIPDIKIQKKTTDFYDLFLKEKNIQQELLSKKELFYQYGLLNYIKENYK